MHRQDSLLLKKNALVLILNPDMLPEGSTETEQIDSLLSEVNLQWVLHIIKLIGEDGSILEALTSTKVILHLMPKITLESYETKLGVDEIKRLSILQGYLQDNYKRINSHCASRNNKPIEIVIDELSSPIIQTYLKKYSLETYNQIDVHYFPASDSAIIKSDMHTLNHINLHQHKFNHSLLRRIGMDIKTELIPNIEPPIPATRFNQETLSASAILRNAAGSYHYGTLYSFSPFPLSELHKTPSASAFVHPSELRKTRNSFTTPSLKSSTSSTQPLKHQAENSHHLSNPTLNHPPLSLAALAAAPAPSTTPPLVSKSNNQANHSHAPSATSESTIHAHLSCDSLKSSMESIQQPDEEDSITRQDANELNQSTSNSLGYSDELSHSSGEMEDDLENNADSDRYGANLDNDPSAFGNYHILSSPDLYQDPVLIALQKIIHLEIWVKKGRGLTGYDVPQGIHALRQLENPTFDDYIKTLGSKIHETPADAFRSARTATTQRFYKLISQLCDLRFRYWLDTSYHASEMAKIFMPLITNYAAEEISLNQPKEDKAWFSMFAVTLSKKDLDTLREVASMKAYTTYIYTSELTDHAGVNTNLSLANLQ